MFKEKYTKAEDGEPSAMSLTTTTTQRPLSFLSRLSFPYSSRFSFSNSKTRIPDSSESVGDLVGTFGRTRCWTLKGPALTSWEKLEPRLREHLMSLQNAQTVAYVSYMFGKSENKAKPTIVIWGGNKDSRQQTMKSTEKFLRLKYMETGRFADFTAIEMSQDPGMKSFAPI